MKKSAFGLFTTALLSGWLLFSTAEPLAIGSSIPLPTVKMKDVSGKEFSFQDAMNSKGLLVMFSCNTCPVVAKYESRTVEIVRYARSKGMGVILLNANEGTRGSGDSYDDMKEYASKKGYDFPYVVDEDSKMADAFGATRTPEVYLFNHGGKLVYRGAIDDNANSPDQVGRKHLRLAVDELYDSKEISTKTTRSVGCSIKRN